MPEKERVSKSYSNLMIELKVNLGEKSYPIFIGSGILDDLTEMLHLYNYAQQVVLITDKNVGKFYGKRLTQNFEQTEKFELIQIPAGEKSKSLKTTTFIINRMLELGFDRNCTVLAVGGGVVGDLAAFVASIYQRGVNIIQVPTTSGSAEAVEGVAIPDWVRNNADWWSQGLISDNDFASGIQYLVSVGIISV